MRQAYFAKGRSVSADRRPFNELPICCASNSLGAKQSGFPVQSFRKASWTWQTPSASQSVHVCRIFKELQRLQLLSKEGRLMKVRDRQRLESSANFDGAYLNMPPLLSRWQVKIDPPR